MATTMRLLFVLLAVVIMMASALQVTPGSPCESFCIDHDDADSTTTGKDITCVDDEFGSKPAGQKFQRCVSCLQDSTFVLGGESDQEWFLCESTTPLTALSCVADMFQTTCDSHLTRASLAIPRVPSSDPTRA